MAIQTLAEPNSSSPPLYFCCWSNTQPIPIIFTKNNITLVFTYCHTNETLKEDLFQKNMGRGKKQRDENMIGSTFAEEDTKDKKI